ncbi:hypothetical protein [Haloterrigena alkaliphila]|uniref:Uncharacterized protein n=1 Tax=Haloterrigena alkaliphila TaxID=2816475 RepID=A0A8A2VFQ2_9EURY|nr:hypothetical protein [Haloterrigena alkaliphila]QSX00137.1 hypothetical protein J0X25_03980 [Haloterrigena alkaliphila]
MTGAIIIVFLLFAIAIPLALWVAIEGETSNPTVVDRTEAERIAQEQGGRKRSGSDSSERAGGVRNHTDNFDEEPGWGTRSEDSDRDDRWR